MEGRPSLLLAFRPVNRLGVQRRVKLDASKVDLPADLLWRAIDLMRRTSSSLETRASVLFATQIGVSLALAAADTRLTGGFGTGDPHALATVALGFVLIGSGFSFYALFPNIAHWDELADLPPRLVGSAPSQVEERWTREQYVALARHLEDVTLSLQISLLVTGLGLFLTLLAAVIHLHEVPRW